jgi:hypothetical protein
VKVKPDEVAVRVKQWHGPVSGFCAQSLQQFVFHSASESFAQAVRQSQVTAWPRLRTTSADLLVTHLLWHVQEEGQHREAVQLYRLRQVGLGRFCRSAFLPGLQRNDCR